MRERKEYRNIAVSCKAKNLLEEIGKLFEEKNGTAGITFNRGVYVSTLIEEAYKKMKEE